MGLTGSSPSTDVPVATGTAATTVDVPAALDEKSKDQQPIGDEEAKLVGVREVAETKEAICAANQKNQEGEGECKLEVCQVLNERAMLPVLLKKDPTHPILEYDAPGSHAYATITSWCDVKLEPRELHEVRVDDRRLYRRADGLLETFNRIPYDPTSGKFVDVDIYKLDVRVLTYAKMQSQLVPQGQVVARVEDERPEELKFLKPSAFSPDLLVELQTCGALSQPMSLSASLLC